MFRSKRTIVHPALLVGLLVTAVSSAAIAQQTNDLGQSFPRTTNLSIAAGWSVYRFDHDGLKYIQINNATGQVLGAIGTSNGQFVTLPIGKDTRRMSTPQKSLTPIDSPAVKIYDDRTTAITARSTSGGATQFWATDLSPLLICPECNHAQQHLAPFSPI